MLDTAAVFLLSGGLLTSEDCTDIRRRYREYDRRWPDPAFPAAAKKPENIGAKTSDIGRKITRHLAPGSDSRILHDLAVIVIGKSEAERGQVC